MKELPSKESFFNRRSSEKRLSEEAQIFMTIELSKNKSVFL